MTGLQMNRRVAVRTPDGIRIFPRLEYALMFLAKMSADADKPDADH